MQRHINKAEAEATFQFHYNNAPDGMGAVRANIMRLLRSVDLVGWTSHEESGRLDRKALTRFATGSTTVFKRRSIKEAESSAVSILIDCSGSMNWHGRDTKAHPIIIQLAKLLDRANVDYAVNGFNGGSRTVTLQDGDFSACDEETLNWIPFKAWNESIQKAAPKLGSFLGWIGSSTPDYSGLNAAIEDLSLRNNPRKILFFVTDADNYEKEHMRHLQKVADYHGILLIALGIDAAHISKVFKHGVSISNDGNFSAVAFNHLLTSLRRA